MPLEGEKVVLRERRESDIPLLRELRNDLVTQGWSRALPPDYTDSMIKKRMDAREFSFNPKEGYFIIELKETGKEVGAIGYTDLEPRFSATIGIQLKKEFFGKSYAFDAQECLLKFLFCELGVQIVRLWTQSGNPGAIGLAKKSGFKMAFQVREAVILRGKLFNNVHMDLLAEEYFEIHSDLSNPRKS